MAISNHKLINSYQNRPRVESFSSKGNGNKQYGDTNTRSFEAIIEQKKVQAIILEKNQTYNLGTINGKPFSITRVQDNRFEWSGGIRISGPAEGKVTPEQMAAARAFASYTPREWAQCDHMVSVIARITRIAEDNLKTDYFNDYVDLVQISPNEINNALQRLGLDPSLPFSVNGRSFVLNSGVLADYNSSKQS